MITYISNYKYHLCKYHFADFARLAIPHAEEEDCNKMVERINKDIEILKEQQITPLPTLSAMDAHFAAMDSLPLRKVN